MGIFDKLTKAVELAKDFMDDGQVNGSSGSSSNAVQKIMSQNLHADHEERNQTIPSAENVERTEKSSSEQMTEIRPAAQLNGISLASTSRIVEGQMYGGDQLYKVSFCINDSFYEFDSHAGEVEMSYVYSPDEDSVEQQVDENAPYIAILSDGVVYSAVSEYKTKGSFKGSRELTPLSGRFLFKAKKEYYDQQMYFYGFDRCDGFWENNGLCLVYPNDLRGTEIEQELMKVLDKAASTYQESPVV